MKEKNILEENFGKTEKPKACELCGCTYSYLNFHHLIPRTLHTNKWFKKMYTREYMGHHGIWICKADCHKQIHRFITEKDMGYSYYTKELLLTHPEVYKYISWRSKRI